MPQVPLPRAGYTPSPTPALSSPNIIPQGDVAGQQMQQAGAALQKAGSVAMSAAAMFRQDEDLVTAKEAYNKYAEFRAQVLTDYESQVGKSAVGDSREAALKAIEDKRQKLEDGMRPSAKGMFRMSTDKDMVLVKSRAYGHETTQRRVWDRGETVAAISQTVEDAKGALYDHRVKGGDTDQEVVKAGEILSQGASLSHGGQATYGVVAPDAQEPQGKEKEKPEPLWKSQYNSALAHANELADLDGLGKEAREGFLLGVKTQINGGVTQRLLDEGRTKIAKEFLSGLGKDDIDQGEAVKLRSLVRRASVKEEGARLTAGIVDEIITDHVKETTLSPDDFLDPDDFMKAQMEQVDSGAIPGEPSAEAIQAAGYEEIYSKWKKGDISIEVRDAAIAELKMVKDGRALAETEARNGILQEAEQWLIDNPDAPVDQMPISLYHQVRALGLEDDLNNFSGSNKRYSTDWSVWSQLLAGSSELLGKSEADFRSEMRPKLSPDYFEKAMSLWRAANEQAAPKDLIALSDARQINLYAERMGIDSGEQPGEFIAFAKSITERINAWQAKTGEDINKHPKQWDVIFDQMVEDRVHQDIDWGVDREKPAAAVPRDKAYVEIVVDGKERNVYLRDISREERSEAVEAIRKENLDREKREPPFPPLPMTEKVIVETVYHLRGHRIGRQR